MMNGNRVEIGRVMRISRGMDVLITDCKSQNIVRVLNGG